MTSEEIRVELFKRRRGGVNMAAIARGLDPSCSRQAVSAVIDRQIASRRIALAVADAIDQDSRLVFPEYFRKKN